MPHNIEHIYFHASQFPDRIARDYEESFIQRRINHKFHYHTTQQSQQWLNLHSTYSPMQQSQGYQQAYEHCFHAALNRLDQENFDLISLGCGGGEKEVLLRSLLKDTLTQNEKKDVVRQASMVNYYPVDVSHALAIIAAQAMRRQYPDIHIQPMVCDLLHTDDLLSHMPRGGSVRLLTFFCMIPNLDPRVILPILNQFLSPGDLLLFSANLAPGENYTQGMEDVLPQYDNPPTKTWLMSVLGDAGIAHSDGDMHVTIDNDVVELGAEGIALKKVNASFMVKRPVTLTINGKVINWQPGESVQLFYSYRYTTPLVKMFLNHYGIDVLDNWEFNDHEEGLYLCRKA